MGKTIKIRLSDEEYSLLQSKGNMSDYLKRGLRAELEGGTPETNSPIEKNSPEKIIEKIKNTSSVFTPPKEPSPNKEIISSLKNVISNLEEYPPKNLVGKLVPTTKKEIMDLAKKKGFVEPVYDPNVDVS